MMSKELRQALMRATKNNPLAARLIGLLQTGVDFYFDLGEPALTKNMLEIYSFRAELYQRKGGSVEGYEDLLKNLSKFERDQILVPGLIFPEESFTLFVDLKESEVIGILLSHKGTNDENVRLALSQANL